MRFTRSWTTALVTLALSATGASAQDGGDGIQIERRNTGAGTTAAEFMLMGAGARGMAIGNAFAALTRDVESLYYNPAALPLMAFLSSATTVQLLTTRRSYPPRQPGWLAEEDQGGERRCG